MLAAVYLLNQVLIDFLIFNFVFEKKSFIQETDSVELDFFVVAPSGGLLSR